MDPAEAAADVVEAEPAPTLGEIIVTARRRVENLQDVPQTVDVVTGDALQNLNIQRFEDIQALVPGLTLSSGSSGVSNTASIRGVTYASETSASPTVEFSINDAPVSSSFVFQSLFDIGQIEVLRGPQGTLRGRAAPSGAISVTTRAPDLDEYGGYANATLATDADVNLHGAVNVPIVKDVLAVRLAAIIDQNDYDEVESINNDSDPHQKTWAVRGSVRFQPTDDLSATVVYQHGDKRLRSFNPVTGLGSPGGTFRNSGYAQPAILAPGYNGPAIAPGDRLGVTDFARRTAEEQDLVTAEVDWRIADQRLTYVGSYSKSVRTSSAPGDEGNQILGYDFDVLNDTESTYWTHELRIASDQRIAEIFDYVAGVFYSKTSGAVWNDRGPSFGRGAFGSPLGAPNAFAPANERYSSHTIITRDRGLKETSFFASVTAHLDERTELTGGGRYIEAKKDNTTQFLRGAGGFSLSAAGAGGCAANQTPSTFHPGFCDTSVAAGPLGAAQVENGKRTPFIYNLQLSHRFSNDLMAYANLGTSWRDGPAVVGITNGGTGSDGGPGDPVLRDLMELDPEKSKSYEIGLKANFLDRRGQVNLALYRQKFNGLIYRGLPTYYLSDNGFTAPSVSTFQFTSNADAKVKGVDLDASFQATSRWRINGAVSYADGKIDNDFIPCNDGNFDGVPDAIVPTVAGFQAAGERIALCRSNRSVSQSPKWNLSLQSEYLFPISDRVDGYVRGLFTYYPDNPRDNETFTIDAYGLLNLYAGVRDAGGGWEVAVFAKNVTKTSQVISQESLQVQSQGGLGNYFGPTGYYNVRYTPPRQVGLNVRYAFGSR
ncbi:TonB-dependent receptor [Phenylobacterium sp. LjRoot219]|uniref:TonB-dependent receptor n=1 Tax=Phenylobacterium sp. LjRoot219 TaxID=3342283 RepID=UPI003ECE66B3